MRNFRRTCDFCVASSIHVEYIDDLILQFSPYLTHLVLIVLVEALAIVILRLNPVKCKVIIPCALEGEVNPSLEEFGLLQIFGMMELFGGAMEGEYLTELRDGLFTRVPSASIKRLKTVEKLGELLMKLLSIPFSRASDRAVWTFINKVLNKALDYDARILLPELFSSIAARVGQVVRVVLLKLVHVIDFTEDEELCMRLTIIERGCGITSAHQKGLYAYVPVFANMRPQLSSVWWIWGGIKNPLIMLLILVHDLLYADDTILFDVHASNVQKYMDVIIAVGGDYGLKINWKKVEVFGVRCNPEIFTTDGLPVEQKELITYLGALISADGFIQSEINRRIGMAGADFRILSVVWSHASVTIYEKYRIYVTCIVSKLLYGLQTSWLTKDQRNKLDGFHARCIRKIVGVAHSYWSRISNLDVLARVNGCTLSKRLLEQQLIAFGKIFRKPDDDIMRQVVFQTGSHELQIHIVHRRRGRPKLNWANEVGKVATIICDGRMVMADPVKWKLMVRKYCRN